MVTGMRLHQSRLAIILRPHVPQPLTCMAKLQVVLTGPEHAARQQEHLAGFWLAPEPRPLPPFEERSLLPAHTHGQHIVVQSQRGRTSRLQLFLNLDSLDYYTVYDQRAICIPVMQKA